MKYAVVTGASAGIGREVTLQLANEGYSVIAVGRNSENLTTLKTENPAQILPVVADIATDDGLDAIVTACRNKPLACVVHCAAILEPFGTLSHVQTADSARYEYHTRTNVTAPMELTKRLSPQLTGGRVMFIGSYFAHKDPADLKEWKECVGAYCESKSVLYAEVQNIQPELASAGISVQYVIPGSVNTALFQQFWEIATQANVTAQPSPTITAKDSATFLTSILRSTVNFLEPLKIWDYKKDLDLALNGQPAERTARPPSPVEPRKWQELVTRSQPLLQSSSLSK